MQPTRDHKAFPYGTRVESLPFAPMCYHLLKCPDDDNIIKKICGYLGHKIIL